MNESKIAKVDYNLSKTMTALKKQDMADVFSTVMHVTDAIHTSHDPTGRQVGLPECHLQSLVS